ncbi:MAG: hypothetical protein OXN88_10435 [Chloroflexota bacterium]|nr:hypothetical protein [Chloroflexota bacterium]
MGCLVLLILAFIFRGAIFGLLAGLIGAVFAVLGFLLSLGIWGIIVILVLCAVATVLE